MIRLFVALELPEEHRLRLRALQGGLPNVRWTPLDNLHVTMRFIGEVDEHVAADLDRELASIEADAFEARLRGVGHFDSRRMARTLWAGMDLTPPLAALQARVEKAAVRTGLAPERRKFHPHVTLARLKAFPLDRLASYMSDFAGFAAPPFTVSAFTLMSSRMNKDGSIYTAEARYPLRQAIPDPEYIAKLA